MANETISTKVTTGKIRLSYFHGWEPVAPKGSTEKKYSTSALIDKDDKLTLGRINKVVDALKEQAKEKYGGKLPKGFKLPLKDGDQDKDDNDENYEGKFFLTATNKNPPGIVSLEKDASGKYKEITDQSEVYSGCHARISLNFFLYDNVGKGIGVSLLNIQKISDGEPFANRSKPDDDFAEEFELGDEDDFMS